jgi:hypothetical protein
MDGACAGSIRNVVLNCGVISISAKDPKQLDPEFSKISKYF